jgi:regulator of telomere elongation helicase 1
LARSKLSNVDIAVLPYNYILTPTIRKKLPLTIENSILIFDEAHNLERSCEEIMSFKLSVDKLIQCDRILNKLEGVYRERDYMSNVGDGSDKGDKLDNTELLRVFVDTLRKTIDNFPSYNRQTSVMQRANIEYYMYDINEIHVMLEEALRPVFRIDR